MAASLLTSEMYMVEHLRLRLGLGGTAANALGLGALEMGCGDPALVVCLCARSDGGAIGADNSNLVSGIDLLGSERRLLGALSALAAALLLGEEGGDPGVVDEVRDAAENGKDNEVQEDAAGMSD